MKKYLVLINFATFIGVEMEYEEWADSREEAEELALRDAADDLSVTLVTDEDGNEIEDDGEEE